MMNNSLRQREINLKNKCLTEGKKKSLKIQFIIPTIKSSVSHNLYRKDSQTAGRVIGTYLCKP